MNDKRIVLKNIAREYVGTPYHPHGRKKGVGVDCLTFLACVYEDAGIIPEHTPIPNYAPDFFKHRADDLYLAGLLKYTHEIQGTPMPGDIVLWKFGRCFSHSAIVYEWPLIIHAHVSRGCIMENVDRSLSLKYIGENVADNGKRRPMKIVSYFW